MVREDVDHVVTVRLVAAPIVGLLSHKPSTVMDMLYGSVS